MKKLLLSTSAIVGVGLVAAPAMAAERIKLSLGGYMEQYIGFVDAEDDAGLRKIASFDQQSDAEVYFKGKTTLDNGITVAANVELEADEANTGIDESYLQVVSPTLGELRLGGDDAVDGVMNVQANRGISGDYDNWIVEAGMSKNDNLYAGTSSDNNKVSYFSPKIMGLQVGLSYAPDINNGATDTPNYISDAHSLWAAAATYDNKFGDVGVKLGANMEHAASSSQTTSASKGHKNYAVGAQFSYQGFVLSGGYARTLQKPIAGGTSTAFDSVRYQAGLQYATGPYQIGVWHMNAANDGTGNTKGDDETTVTSVYGQYTLNDGVALQGMVFNVDYDNEETGTAGDTAGQDGGWGVVAGFRVDF